VLRLVAKNAGDLVSTELVAELWNAYSLTRRQRLLTSGANSGRGVKSLLRPNRKAPERGKPNDHHVVDVTTSPKTANV